MTVRTLYDRFLNFLRVFWKTVFKEVLFLENQLKVACIWIYVTQSKLKFRVRKIPVMIWPMFMYVLIRMMFRYIYVYWIVSFSNDAAIDYLISWDEYRVEFLTNFDNYEIQLWLRADILSTRPPATQSLTELILNKYQPVRHINTGLSEAE